MVHSMAEIGSPQSVMQWQSRWDGVRASLRRLESREAELSRVETRDARIDRELRGVRNQAEIVRELLKEVAA